MRVAELFSFIKERYNIYSLRRQGYPKPWTDDPILQSYRFCNVYRELDTVTQWIANAWREPNYTDPDLWFAMLVARKVNYPGSLESVGYPVPWKPKRFEKIMAERAALGLQMEGGAYMITAGVGERWKGVPKYQFLSSQVFTPLWNVRSRVRPKKGDTLAAFHFRLMNEGNTVGSFIAGQIVADTKYAGVLKNAPDWWTWAAPGPGSERGLSLVMGYDINQKWNPSQWFFHLQELQAAIDPMIAKAKMPRLHAQDLQNCLCEFSKYEKVRLGIGKPRSGYPGKG